MVSFSNVLLYDSAQTQNIFKFKKVSVLHEQELNWNNNMCLDYHNEVKISFEILIFYSFDKKRFEFFRSFIRSKVAHLNPRSWSQ